MTEIPRSESAKHIPSLDGVRGLAILFVFIYHYGGGKQSSFWPLRVAADTVNFGWVGVSLFFVLSGYLITGILWDSFAVQGWLVRFYVRRSLRIFPLYYLALLIAAIAFVASGVSIRVLSSLWVYFLYLQDVPWLYSARAQLPSTVWLVHFWSLAVEEQFYLAWPLLLFMFAGKRKAAMRMMSVLWLASMTFRLLIVVLHYPTDWALLSIGGRSGELIAGGYLALLLRGTSEERRGIERFGTILSTVCLLSFAVLAVYVTRERYSQSTTDIVMSLAGLPLLSVLFPCLIAAALKSGILQTCMSIATLRWLGKISYGIYVYHFLFRHLFDKCATWIYPTLGPVQHQAFVGLVAAAGTLLIASFSFYTLETAFIHIKSRTPNRAAQTSAALGMAGAEPS
jgi:peptidoglycan/LPS O-acetylase OafA/YrhL